MTDSPNYCQHPECHNSRIAYYADYYYSRAASDTRPWVPDGRWMSLHPPASPAVPVRRWCHAHALLNERVAYGSPS